MKKYVVSGFIVLIAAFSSLAGVSEGDELNTGDVLSGRIGVGSHNKGTACGFRVTQIRNDIYNNVYKIEMGQYKSINKKWTQVSDKFEVRDYNGQLEGSIQKVDARTGRMKKVTIRIFNEVNRPYLYKAILDENNLGSASEANRFTVCEGMIKK